MWRQALATDEGVGLPQLKGRWCYTGPGRLRGGAWKNCRFAIWGALEFGNILYAKPQGIHSPPRGLARSGFGLWRGGDH